MNIKKVFLVLFALTFFLAACQQASSTAAPKVIPTPEKGKAIVTGRIVATADSKPYTNTEVHLAKIFRQGDQAAYVLDTATAPSALSDENGYFAIVNVPVADYAFIVGDPAASYRVIPDDKGGAKIWTTVADKTLDLGTIQLNLTP